MSRLNIYIITFRTNTRMDYQAHDLEANVMLILTFKRIKVARPLKLKASVIDVGTYPLYYDVRYR